MDITLYLSMFIKRTKYRSYYLFTLHFHLKCLLSMPLVWFVCHDANRLCFLLKLLLGSEWTSGATHFHTSCLLPTTTAHFVRFCYIILYTDFLQQKYSNFFQEWVNCTQFFILDLWLLGSSSVDIWKYMYTWVYFSVCKW